MYRNCPDNPDGEPLLGVEKCINNDIVIKNLFDNLPNAEWVKTPTNNLPLGNPDASNGDNHIDLDDEWTLQATIAGILAP